jgi:predicted DNA-binding protein
MKKSTKYAHCMTLRLPADLEAALESLSSDLGISKAGLIRRILARAIVGQGTSKFPI